MEAHTERVEKLTHDYRELVEDYEPEDFVFVDECGVNTNMTRSHARSRRGQRVRGTRPLRRGKNITLLAAMSMHQGTMAARSFEGSMTRERFLDWLDTGLLPYLDAGQVVVMDNLRVHKCAEVRDRIEAAGCKLIFLPPYSPHLNPIEMMWSKLKAYLRKRAVRERGRLKRAIHHGLRTVRMDDINGWTIACGY